MVHPLRGQASRPSARLAVSGKAGAGKDTLVEAVRSLTPQLDWRQLTFGEAVRVEGLRILRMLAAAREEKRPLQAQDLGLPPACAAPLLAYLNSGLDPEHVTADKERLRPVLQLVGDAYRCLDERYWIARTAVQLQTISAACDAVAIADVRTRSEAEWARDEGFLLVRLAIGDLERRRRLMRRGHLVTDAAQRHATETGLDGFAGFDLTIDEDLGLRQASRMIVDRLLRGPTAVPRADGHGC